MSDEQKDKISQLKSASVVARVAELLDVRLASLSSAVHVEPEDVVDKECALQVATSTGYDYDEKRSILNVQMSARVGLREVTEETADNGPPIFSIDANFRLAYQLPSPAPPEELREELFSSFAAINGVYNAWPYLRELVQSITGRMGFPSLLIPLYRLPRSGGDAAVQEEQPSPKLKLVAGGE